jgi:hypothetical protein
MGISDRSTPMLSRAGSTDKDAALEGDGPGSSDKVSDNDPRQRQTQRDVPRHRYPAELQ